MATYTDITINQNTGIGSGKIDGILFSSVNLAEGFKPIGQPKIAPLNSIFSPDGNQSNKSLIINAVDIDWNGAKPGLGESSSIGITTTGELLKYIKQYATIKTQLGTTAIGSKTKPIYWNGSSFATANDYPEYKTLGELFIDEIQKWMTGGYSDSNLPVLSFGNAGTISLPKSFFDLNNDNTIGISDISLPTDVERFAMGFIIDYAKKWYNKTPSEGTTYTAGTNITISSNTINHKTPSGASSGKKGNKSATNTALLATITTDAQGHVTGYETISIAELKELLGITDPVTIIKLDVIADNSQIVYNGSTILRASLSNDGLATGTTWSIVSGGSYGQLSTTSGATVTLTGTNTATGGITNKAGTITSYDPALSSIAYNSNTTVQVSATTGSVVTGAGTDQPVIIRATNASATSGYQTKDVTVTVNGRSGSSTSSAVSSYKWEFTAGSDYAALQNDTSATVTVVNNNSSSSNQTVTVRCKVTWANGKSAYSTAKSITVQKQDQGNTWYKGTATDSQIQTQSYIDGLTYNQATKPANNSTLTLSSGYNVFIFPSTWNTPTFGGNSDYSKVYAPYTASDLGITNPSGKAVYVVYSASNNVTAYIKF